MSLRRLFFIGILGALACTELSAPTRAVPYESRLFIPFDDNGTPAIDSVRFHWPASSIPVTYWVEDSLNAPAHARAAIETWKRAFLYGEWDARVVSDSSSADVIVRVLQPPVKPAPQLLRFASRRPECEGATDIDTVATRRELRLPVRIYVSPRLINDPSLALCMEITTTHEMGHSMGLFQHSGDPVDIMYADPEATELSARDIATIEALYHRQADMLPVHP
jgi:predicted Zn-dependent protease